MKIKLPEYGINIDLEIEPLEQPARYVTFEVDEQGHVGISQIDAGVVVRYINHLSGENRELGPDDVEPFDRSDVVV